MIKIILLILFWTLSLKRSSSSFFFSSRDAGETLRSLSLLAALDSHTSLWQNHREKENMTENSCSQKSGSTALQYPLWFPLCSTPPPPRHFFVWLLKLSQTPKKPTSSKSKCLVFSQSWLPDPPDVSWGSTSMNGINIHPWNDASRKTKSSVSLPFFSPPKPTHRQAPFHFQNISKSTHCSLPLLPPP